MEKIYSMPCLFGACFYKNKNVAISYIDEKGKNFIISKKNKTKIIYHNIAFLRGLEYLIFGLFYFIKNLIKMPIKNSEKNISEKISKGLNINKKSVFIFGVIIFGILGGIVLFGIIPIKLALIFSNYTKNIFLFRFFVGFNKNLLLFLILFSIRFITPFRQFYRFNGCINILTTKNENLHKPTNLLNYLIFSFFICNFVLAFLGQSSNNFWKIFLNLFVAIFCFCATFELLYFLENCKTSWLKKLAIITSFLISEKPTKTEIYIASCGLVELEFMKTNKRGLVDTKQFLENEESFSSVYALAKQQLCCAGIFDTSEVDFLICEVLKINRSQLLLQTKVTKKQKEDIEKAVKRRIKGEPITKIFGRTEFFGYEFIVTKDVLSPRQETEILVENVLKYAKRKMNILDLCTGSGIIAISLAKNVDANITATDISEKALLVAKQNAQKNNVKIELKLSNLFEDLKNGKKFDIIVSNPPYIPSKDINSLDVEVKNYDPKLALDGGDDGLDFYKKIASVSPKFLAKGGRLFLEIGYNQKEDVISLLQDDFEDIICIKDYSKCDRVIIAKVKEKGKRDVRTNNKN